MAATARPFQISQRRRGLMAIISLTTMGGLAAEDLSWRRTDTSLALFNGTAVVWQLVFDPAQDKPYFHPLATIDGDTITALRPPDHAWHRGLWWSWKFINGINYWEEDPVTNLSAGRSTIISATVEPHDDYSARIVLAIGYHPVAAAPVLREERELRISPPDNTGSYRIEWTSRFTSGDVPVVLERTAPYQRNGTWAGGYAGLALRGALITRTGWTFTAADPGIATAQISGNRSPWVDFSGPFHPGTIGGVAILDHPANPGHPAVFYANAAHPMLHPAILWNEPLHMAAQTTMTWRYLVIVHRGAANRAALQADWLDFAKR